MSKRNAKPKPKVYRRVFTVTVDVFDPSDTPHVSTIKGAVESDLPTWRKLGKVSVRRLDASPRPS